MLAKRLNQLKIVGITPIPAPNRTTGQAQFGITNHTLGIKELGMAQAIAGRAGAVRIVEREHARLKLGNTVAADRAGKTR